MPAPAPRTALRAALVAALLAAAAAPLHADSDEHSATCFLESTPVFPGTDITLTVRSPLVGATVFVASDGELGPTFAGDPTMPVLQLSPDYAVVGMGTIDASGRFSVSVPTPLGLPLFVQAVVIDAGGRWHASQLRPVLFGLTPLSFGDGTLGLDPLMATSSTIDADWLDFDKDGCGDVIVAAGGSPVLLQGDCTGALVRTDLHRRIPWSTECLEVADVDGDSWPDLFVGGGFDFDRPLPNLLLLNDRSGGFLIASGVEAQGTGYVGLGQLPGQSPSPALPGGRGIAVDAEFGDVDGDGDVDLFVASVQDFDHPGEQPDPVTLYLNQGGAQGGAQGAFLEDPAFSALPGNQPLADGGAVTMGDVDNDGDLDVFVCSSNGAGGGSQSRLYVNDGAGSFTDVTTSLPQGMDKSFDATFGDFDADGDLDVIVANNIFSDPDAVHLYRNETLVADSPDFVDGSSALPASLGTNTLIRLTAEAGDVDMDGDLDVLLGIHELPGGGGPLGTDGRAVLLINQAGLQGMTAGTFAVSNAFQPGIFIDGDLALGDADGDGDLDVYLANVGNLFQFDFHDELWINGML